MQQKLNKSDYSFFLPEELIAQTPTIPRDECKLLCLKKHDDNFEFEDKIFKNIKDMLNKGDVLVLNNSKVLPARLYGQKTTGAKCEIVLLKQVAPDEWECLAKPGKKLKDDSEIVFDSDVLSAKVIKTLENKNKLIKFFYKTQTIYEALDIVGKLPLPHYITTELVDNSLYQTEYAKTLGSAAAPTAGLHFTKELLAQLEEKGVKICYITLHVGLGTFRPVKVDNILDHEMHSEWFSIPKQTADNINFAKENNNKVVAVGTTSIRTLESCYKKHQKIIPCEMDTDIFIYPGYKFNIVDALITNFHLPQSTLIMLVSALCGYENCMKAYEHAVENKYRFYSFGDAMFIY